MTARFVRVDCGGSEMVALVMSDQVWLSVPQVASQLEYRTTQTGAVARLVGREHRLTVVTPVLRGGKAVGVIDLHGVREWCARTYHKEAAGVFLRWVDTVLVPAPGSADGEETTVTDVHAKWSEIAARSARTRGELAELIDALARDESLSAAERGARLSEFYERKAGVSSE